MKKTRKVFIISWFYLIGAIIMVLSPIVLFVLCIYDLCIYHKDVEMYICLVIFCIFAFIVFFIIFGIYFWQWVVIDENKITARNIFYTIREITWENVEEVMGVPIAYNALDPIMHWFLFVDNKGGKVWIKSPFNVKGRCIKIKASKKTREFLLQCKPDLEFTTYDGGIK